MKTEEDKTKEQQAGKTLFIILFFYFILSLIYSITNGRGGSKTHKLVIAHKYGFTKTVSLMRWIRIFCPSDITEKYVGKKVHYIDEREISHYLGSPNSYPKLSDGNIIDNKPSLAKSLFLSPKTFQRRMYSIPNFEKQMGITLEQYKSLKRIPPKQVEKIQFFFQER